MILELTGLPGAGKTTCEQYISAELNKRGYQVLGPGDVLRCYVRDRIYANLGLSYSLRRHLLIRAMVSVVFHTRVVCADLRNRFSIGQFLGAFAKNQRLSCRRLSHDILISRYFLEELLPSYEERHVYVASEGLTHHSAAVKVWAGERYFAMSDRWLAHHSCDEMVIVRLQVPLDTALDRLWQRGLPTSWPRKSKTDRRFTKSILSRFAEAIEESVQRYQAAGARVFTLDCSCDIATLASNTAGLVESLVATTRTRATAGANWQETSGQSSVPFLQ